jgi:RHS repeat-associated protein
MVATAPPTPSSLAGSPAQGRSAFRIASDGREATEVAPENDDFGRLEYCRPDRGDAATRIGRVRPHRGNSHPARRRFSGQTRSGRYSWARYYHPDLQRFISEDPIGFGGGDFNLYAYVRNNPLGNRDPLGLIGEAVCGALDGIGSSLVSETQSLAGRKDGLASTLPDQARIVLAAAARPDQLNRCLDACEAGGRAIENFCRSLPDPRARGLCWASRWTVPVCKGMCYALFGRP